MQGDMYCLNAELNSEITVLSETKYRITVSAPIKYGGSMYCLVNVYLLVRVSMDDYVQFFDILDMEHIISTKYESSQTVFVDGDFNASLHSHSGLCRDRIMAEFVAVCGLNNNVHCYTGDTILHTSNDSSSQIVTCCLLLPIVGPWKPKYQQLVCTI